MVDRRLIAVAFLLFLSSTIVGQAIEWQENYGGSDADHFFGSLVDDSGQVFVGWSRSGDHDVSSNYGDRDVWVVRTDTLGDIVWEKNYGGSNEDRGIGIARASDGDLFIHAASYSSDQDLSGNYGYEDSFLMRLNDTGGVEWTRRYGSSDGEYIGKIAAASDGACYIVGASPGNDHDLDTNRGSYDAWVARIDSAGNEEWFHSYGGSGNDELWGVTVPSDGGCVVTGSSDSDDGDLPNDPVFEDKAWIMELDSSGGVEWSRTYGGGDYDHARESIENDSGDIVVGITSQSQNGDISGWQPGQTDMNGWIVQLDSSDGSLMWGNVFGGDEHDAVWDLKEDPNGGYLIGGKTHSSGGDIHVPQNSGSTDFWVYKIDDSGAFVNSVTFGGSNYESLWTLELTPDGGMILGGASNSFDGDLTGNYDGGWSDDAWGVKLRAPCDSIPMSRHIQNDTICYSGDIARFGLDHASFVPVTYDWQVDSGNGWNSLSAPSQDSLILPGLTMADSGNSYRCVLDNGCGATIVSGPATLHVGSPLTFEDSVQHSTCFDADDGSFTVEPSGGTPPYYFSSNGGISFDGPDTVFTRSGLFSIGYSVLVKDQVGCQVSDTITITEPPPLQVEAGPDLQVCDGDTVRIGQDSAANGGNGGYSFDWSPNTNLSDDSISDPLAYPLQDRTYSLTVTDSNGCTENDQMQVEVAQDPVALIVKDQPLNEPNDTVTLDASYSTSPSGQGAYSWTALNGGQFLTSSSTSPTVKVRTEGLYVLEFTDTTTGCKDMDSLVIERVTGLKAHQEDRKIKVSPNPTTGQVTVAFGPWTRVCGVRVHGPKGDLLEDRKIGGEDRISITLDGAPGLYTLKVLGRNGNYFTRKLIKKQ